MEFIFTLTDVEANLIMSALGKAPLSWEQTNPLIFKIQQQAAPVLKAAAEEAQAKEKADAAKRPADGINNVRQLQRAQVPVPDGAAAGQGSAGELERATAGGTVAEGSYLCADCYTQVNGAHECPGAGSASHGSGGEQALGGEA